jgi:cardiolipin synthase
VAERWNQTWTRHRRAFLAAAIGFAVVAAIIFFAQDPETLRVESPVAATDARFPEYVASLLGAPVETGDAYTVLHNGDEMFPAMLSAIESAKSRINFETYVFKDGEIGDRVVEALANAATRGVTVRMIVDPIGSLMKPKNRDRLAQSGATLSWFNPIGFFTIEVANYRTHRKTLVVDGQIGFTGGMGVADYWMGHAQDKDHWRDTHFKIEGPSVRELEGSFYENWIETGGRSAPALDLDELPRKTSARSVVVWSNPMSGASNMKLLYLLSIAGARKTIDIQSPYITLDASTKWSLQQARLRGVKVRMLAEGYITDAMPVKHAGRYAYQGLLDEGIDIYEYQPTMMHTKATMIDGTVSLIGSANFSNRSFELNDELTIAVFDPDLASRLTADFERDLNVSQRLLASTWPSQRSFDSKLQEWFWSWFGEMF